jgi:hypothetical protein
VGGYPGEVLIDLPTWPLSGITASGAGVGLVLAWLADRCRLPAWLKPVSIGSLIGVSIVVLLALLIENMVSASRKDYAFRTMALKIGVPIGLVAGAVAGFVNWQRHRHIQD